MLEKLTAIPTKDIFTKFESEVKNSVKSEYHEMKNEIKPDYLYRYLYAKHGMPNGIQNFLRNDHSDNMVHWEWNLDSEELNISILGLNFRSEVFVRHKLENLAISINDIISFINNDMKNYRKEMSQIKNNLEKWQRFINPYQRIKSAVDTNFAILEELNINPKKDKIKNDSEEDFNDFTERFNALSQKYNHAIGIAFGLRTMLPVLGESFLNLLIFILAKPELKKIERLLNSITREQIDVRIQKLHINCVGFKKTVEFSHDKCKKFNTLMNHRNDLLHGNVDPKKLDIGTVYFNGTVPVFTEYVDFWDQALGASLDAVKFDTIMDDYKTVKDFIDFIISHLDENTQELITYIIQKRELGFNAKNKRLAALFADIIHDFRLGFEKT